MRSSSQADKPEFGRMSCVAVPIAMLTVLMLSVLAQRATAQDENREQERAKDETDFFETHVRPIFVERCQGCHGQLKAWADLRLDSAEGLAKGGESGEVVKRGHAGDSEIYRRIKSEDNATRMPPPDAGKTLSIVEIENIRTWIDRGATWPETSKTKTTNIEEHWAFQPVSHPVPPTLSAADYVSESLLSPQNPLDAFVRAELQLHDMEPSVAADRRTLIRRASYDLLGIPPSEEEVAAFVQDTEPSAYERLIDQLLASPHYGERWGRHWLDVARYSDTKGYVYGREEREFYHASHYRDWVIKAFNDDMPYDRFVLMQLAADQAAHDQPEHLAAMGYLTLGRRFLGVESDIIDDRIDVVGRGLLGLTIGCARCHDHKYDPIPTADYYSLYGVFQSCWERTVDLPSNSLAGPPTQEYLNGLHDREKQLDDLVATRRSEAEARIRLRVSDYLYAQRELDKYPDASFNQFTTKDDIIPGIVARWEWYLSEARITFDPIVAPWLFLADLKDDEFADRSASVCDSIVSDKRIHPLIADLFGTPPQNAREVADRYGTLFKLIDSKWQTAVQQAKEAGIPEPTRFDDPNEESLRQFLYSQGSPCTIPHESIASIEWVWDLDTVVELWKKQAELDQWLLQGQATLPRAVTLVDAKFPVTPRVFRRGNPANKGNHVPRQFLQVAQGANVKPFETGSGRLELAQAIIDPKNPLTARVWVNRVWQHHFGRGLVNSPSDFGLRAAPPSHPELLDWLASEFMAHGWSNRWLHRTIMTSSAYCQSSSGPSTLEQQARCREIDPENRLLWRKSTHRLTWEELRDTMLSLSDKMDSRIGGTSTESFATVSGGAYRRSTYNRVDRQYLPTVFNVFDFANPDMHSPQRSETTVPQQSLFLLNHVFMAEQSKSIAKQVASVPDSSEESKIRALYHRILHREPTDLQLGLVSEFLKQADDNNTPKLSRPEWSYGYGPMDQELSKVLSFTPLPFASSTSWQGSAAYPDPKLGWVQVSASTSHAGNDVEHAAIRRWTAPHTGKVALLCNVAHENEEGDGVEAIVVSSRSGLIGKNVVHNRKDLIRADSIEVEAGETIDFITRLHGTLNYEGLSWSIELSFDGTEAWNSVQDFQTEHREGLTPFEQLIHALLMSNEVHFVD